MDVLVVLLAIEACVLVELTGISDGELNVSSQVKGNGIKVPFTLLGK